MTLEPKKAELTNEDRLEFQSKLPYMGLKLGELSAQEERFVLYYTGGMSAAAAARMAGYSSKTSATNILNKESVKRAVDYWREEFREEVNFTKNHAHSMYMQAYASAVNSTEMKNTTDSLVKLHGLAKEEQKPLINIQINGTKQLERLTDEELLELAGKTIDHLEPSAD